MASKTFRIQRRFEVWVEMEIRAASMKDAVDVVAESTIDDFFSSKKSTEVLDVTVLKGNDAVFEA